MFFCRPAVVVLSTEAIAAAIEEPSSSALAERATSALDALLAELAQITAGKPRVS
jgi:hypothetical protein